MASLVFGSTRAQTWLPTIADLSPRHDYISPSDSLATLPSEYEPLYARFFMQR